MLAKGWITMGLFDSIKKFADEVSDNDSCTLGDQIPDSALMDQLREIVAQNKDGRVSTTEIQHKKIENLQTNLGLDYHKAVFFIDTTMMRNNGSRGIGATIDCLYWNFSNNDAHHLALTDLALCNLSEAELTQITTTADNQAVTQTFNLDSKITTTVKQIKELFDNDQTVQTNYQAKVNTILHTEQVSNEVLQQLELLTITNTVQHAIIETKLIDQAFDNNDWSSIATNLIALNVNDSVAFENKRQTVLEQISKRLNSNNDINHSELTQLNYLLNKFDYDHLFTNEIIKLQVRLGKSFDAKITAYARLGETERNQIISEIAQTEATTRNIVENAVEQTDSNYFENHQAQTNLALTAGLLPVEYALLLKKPTAFINELIQLTDSDLLTNPSNVYQFSLEELAASHKDKDYFLATVSDNANRPKANLINKISHTALNDNANAIRLAKKQGQDVSEAEQKYNEQAERVRQADDRIEEAQRDWDRQTSEELSKSRQNFYYNLTGINTNALKTIFCERYLAQTQANLNATNNQLDQLTNSLHDLQHTLDNPIDDLVDQRYTANKLVRGEFEKAEDFEQRVLDCRQSLKTEITETLDSEISQLTQEFDKKTEKAQQLAQDKNSLAEQLKFGNQIINTMLSEITDPTATSFVKKIVFDPDLSDLTIGKYNPDSFNFAIDSPLGATTIEVPIEIASQFRDSFSVKNVTDFRIERRNDHYLVLAVYPFKGTVYYIPMEKLPAN